MERTAVLKFGGASLKDLRHFEDVATIIEKEKEKFEHVVVVVSAMEGMTDQLLDLSKKVHINPPKREQDMLLTVGERISMSLMAMVLSQRGLSAKSFTGSQAGIVTCSRHSEARIIDVRPKRVIPHLEEGSILIVAGFQGVSLGGEITTLGRGGSDSTAVALGIALGAEKVSFYKDVKGIYTSDPKSDQRAELIPCLNYEEALEVVSRGAHAVLHERAVVLAARNHIPLHVLPFDLADQEEKGSIVVSDSKDRPSPPLFEQMEEEQAI